MPIQGAVKERHFTTPLALHAKRAQHWNANAERPPKKPKGKGRGKGKEGRAKKLKEGSDRTPEGQPICFRYNAKGCKNGDKCHFAHVCVLCFGKHPPRRQRSRRPRPRPLRTDLGTSFQRYHSHSRRHAGVFWAL